ncbi:MAG: AAA family ATPase [Ornithinimicrobium sp.]|uniref:AAA family ATPase n=1 Tax=Ornithinimicrobium sp. TaxID=1977084 RepID=UPI003D9BA0A4
MSLPALTAVTHRWESELAGHLGRSAHVHVARRCADLAELLGCAAAGIGQVAAVSVDLRGLDASALAELRQQGVRVLGVHPPGDEAGLRTLRRWGVAAVVSADAEAAQIEQVLALLVSAPAVSSAGAGAQGERALLLDAQAPAERLADSTPQPAGSGSGTPPTDPDVEAGDRRGRVVAVWGPTGAPGRTTLAIHLAAALGTASAPSILVDADTYGASVAQVLAVLDEAPGLAAAVRAADQGVLDRASLARLAPLVQPGMRVLTGLPRADRWPELREHAVADVLAQCPLLAAWTIIDTGFCLERDEELSYDTSAPRRNGASLASLAAADVVVVVGSADPVGLQRLVRALDDLRAHVVVPVHVVVNRVRSGSVGRDPDRRVRESLQRFAGLDRVHLIPDDREALDAAVLHGRTLSETRPGSPAYRAVLDLAGELAGVPGPSRRRDLGRRRRRR